MGTDADPKQRNASSTETKFLDMLFSWSLEDILDKDLYKNQVETIPLSFHSSDNYLGSFVYPFLEEVRAELSSPLEDIHSAPFAEIFSLDRCNRLGSRFYNMKVTQWRNTLGPLGKEPYQTRHGDICVLTEARPEICFDLKRSGRTWAFGHVTTISTDDTNFDSAATSFKLKTSMDLGIGEELQKLKYIIFLMNTTSSKRIWSALHPSRNIEVIDKVLGIHGLDEDKCNMCPEEREHVWKEKLSFPYELNSSQYDVVHSCVHKVNCNHRSHVELIWGPPGTGKTRTLSLLLYTLVSLKCKTLTCAPTNVAISEVTSCVLKLIRGSTEKGGGVGNGICSFGDVLLFGNKEKLNVTSDIEVVYLDSRVKKLAEVFSPVSGWRYCFSAMIQCLEDSVTMYEDLFDSVSNKGEYSRGTLEWIEKGNSFIQFVRDRVLSGTLMKRCISTVSTFCTHIPVNFIEKYNFERLMSLMEFLYSLRSLLHQTTPPEELGAKSEAVDNLLSSVVKPNDLLIAARSCLADLKTLQSSLDKINLPKGTKRDSISSFCFQTASLILCTSSSSCKLNKVEMEPIRLLVVDEAAQLKECESLIPLQLPGIKHCVLVGDECQLPAMVHSTVSKEAGFGRSLFERLSLLGHPRKLLNIQYRMHPAISIFPNTRFYQNKLMDASSVKSESYTKPSLPGEMFGPFSFINISYGREHIVDRGSRKNMVEVAVVEKMVQLLFRAHATSKDKLSIGIVSPYSSQIAEIQRKLGVKYENLDNFSVDVKSIDGCQGGEFDVVIISTVRCSSRGSIGFMSSQQRVNVALTRARHHLWILGSEEKLINSGSVWEELIYNAKVRQCFFNAEDDKDFEELILDVKKELNQLEDLLTGDSMLFKKATWKVLFSDDFRRSFVRLKPLEMKNLVLLFLSKLTTGWRPKRSSLISCDKSSHTLRSFKVRDFYIICSIDIVQESWYFQVLKVWDVLPPEAIPKLVKRLNGIFAMYTDNYIRHCQKRRTEGGLEVPMTWDPKSDIVQYKNLGETKNSDAINALSSDGEGRVEKAMVTESLLLMKFYSLSSGVVGKMLSSCNGEELSLPFELSSQEQEIIHYDRSTFIQGRSGTGKTTVLTMKMFQNEQIYHLASEGYHDVESYTTNDSITVTDAVKEVKDRLRQLFVTVSPKLCYAVKHQFSQLNSLACREKLATTSSSLGMDDIDDAGQFSDIPNSFIDIPPVSYPLIITFSKFLMMLDGTVGTSYFERFYDARKLSHGKSGSERSLAFQTFIRAKEVTFEKFESSYWPHFNDTLTKKLDCCAVFVEIMSVIKGGLPAGDGRLCKQDYVMLSDSRASALSRERREAVYDIFLAYEKRKILFGDFDIADLVIDLHFRLKNEEYVGDEIEFVYIDEVQDLSMRQVALFKYVCRNVHEGFVFCGDTAQTIARGISFRFQDLRNLFYVEFILGSKGEEADARKGKGLVSDIFHLNQNFRTHGGILRLAQSVIELLYHFFPHSIDDLHPESSLLYGEAPTLLVPQLNQNSLSSLFKGKGDSGGHIVGFGANQVILVRDDRAKDEIAAKIGKQALVLTIMECKGLEFQDVLMYNFFSNSPCNRKWGVIYDLMKDKNLMDQPSTHYYQSFNVEKHTILCSEFKQLYVAITRTRQRLWIYEDVEGEAASPIFYYWKKLGLAREIQLDDSFIAAMQVASSKEEWKSRGIKLFHERNYEMALMCFERAGDTYWESCAKAASLCSTANQMGHSNPETSHAALRKAAEIYESIDKPELAAECYFKINEYDLAGRIYREKCGASSLKKAGECFLLARRYKRAAEAYAKANSYGECLSACLAGQLFDIGLKYINSWKQYATSEVLREIDTSCQEFLHRGAIHYYELKNHSEMMRFVRCFQSMDSIRTFLKSINFLNELLHLESERGNFLEASSIAKLKGDVLLEAEMLEKGGSFREASMITIWYVFENNLSLLDSRRRPHKKFDQKEVLEKARLLARKYHCDLFYEFICKEVEILSSGSTENYFPIFGLQFISCWKDGAPSDVDRIEKTYLKKTEQYLLEKCASYYYRQKEIKTMMRYVKDFNSIDRMRSFLKSLNCLDELLMLEEENGNYAEAADVAEQKGDIIHKADLLKKCGRFKEASSTILCFVLATSLWSPGSKGWPLKPFTQMEELLEKARLCAHYHSDLLYEYVSVEAEILLNRERNLPGIMQQLVASRTHRSIGGEILSVWKILDAHLSSDTEKYMWNNVLVDDVTIHSDEMISHDMISGETLVSFWDIWKMEIVKLIDSTLKTGQQDDIEHLSYWEFSLNYMGVRHQNGAQSTTCFVLNPEADWLRETNPRLLQRKGNMVSIDLHHFISAASNYWISELFLVGQRVLKSLKALYDCSVKNSSVFHQSTSLLHLFEVAKFFKDYKVPHGMNTLSRMSMDQYLSLSVQGFCDNVFSLDWRKSSSRSMILLRDSDRSKLLMKEAVFGNIGRNFRLPYGQMGRQVMMFLGCGKLSDEPEERLIRCFGWNNKWKKLVQSLSVRKPTLRYTSSLTQKLYEAIADAYLSKSKLEKDFLSPACFLYLLERLVFMISYSPAHFFTTKVSVVEWLFFEEWPVRESDNSSVNETIVPLHLGGIVEFVANVIQELLLNKFEAVQWIRTSGNVSEDSYSLLVLRLMSMLCVLCVSTMKHFDKLTALLKKRYIRAELPKAFFDAICRTDCYFIDALGVALMEIGNSLVMVRAGEEVHEFPSSNMLSVNLKGNKCKEDIVEQLFTEEETTAFPSYGNFWETVKELLLENGRDIITRLVSDIKFKVEIARNVELLNSEWAWFSKNYRKGELKSSAEALRLLNDWKQLSAFLDLSEEALVDKAAAVIELLRRTQLRRIKLEPILNHLVQGLFPSGSYSNS